MHKSSITDIAAWLMANALTTFFPPLWRPEVTFQPLRMFLTMLVCVNEGRSRHTWYEAAMGALLKHTGARTPDGILSLV
mgnify:CR=1 FL=1